MRAHCYQMFFLCGIYFPFTNIWKSFIILSVSIHTVDYCGYRCHIQIENVDVSISRFIVVHFCKNLKTHYMEFVPSHVSSPKVPELIDRINVFGSELIFLSIGT
jgi:hypothetical protein